MPRIKTQISIDAPKELIWKILTDFENYHTWNPLIPKIICQKSLDSKITIHLRSNGMILPIKARVTDYAINRKFGWGGPGINALKFIVSANHYFEIVQIKDGQCLFKHEEAFSGYIPKLLWPIISKLEPSYSEMNTALKEKVESIYST